MGKKKTTRIDDGWMTFEGDFSVDDLRAAARSGETIPRLSINKTRFTRRRSFGLRGLRAAWLRIWCEVTKAALTDVLAIEGLQQLDVFEIATAGTMPSFAPAGALEAFRCPTGIAPADIAAIVQAPALRHLSLQCAMLDMPLVRTFATLSNLRSLDIEATNFDDDMAEVITSHQTLTGLDVGATPLTARGLAHICRMRQLESLDLWATAIRVDDLQQLTALERLQYLSLGTVEGSDTDGLCVEGDPSHDARAVVDLLLRIPSLKRVWLDGVKLSPEQKHQLESRLDSLQM